MHIIKLSATPSTNNYLKQLYSEQVVANFTIVVASNQLKGKGQMGTSWESESGKNLTFSILLKDLIVDVKQLFTLNILVSLALVEVLERYKIPNVTVKWPNDIMSGNLKLGGILIENVLRGTQWQWAIAGIGINVNQTVFGQLQNPVSIKQITGKETPIKELAQAIHAKLLHSVAKLEKEGFEEFLQQYNQQLYKQGEQVTLKKGNRSFTTTINGVSRQGQLQTGIETEENFDFGEVEWVL